MLKKTIVLTAKDGFHARPASMFVKMANGFQSEISLIHGENVVNGKSIMSILTLGATCGAEVGLLAEGPDEGAAIEALSDFLAVME